MLLHVAYLTDAFIQNKVQLIKQDQSSEHLGVKGHAQWPNCEITLPILGFELAIFQSRAQHPNPHSNRLRHADRFSYHTSHFIFKAHDN